MSRSQVEEGAGEEQNGTWKIVRSEGVPSGKDPFGENGELSESGEASLHCWRFGDLENSKWANFRMTCALSLAPVGAVYG